MTHKTIARLYQDPIYPVVATTQRFMSDDNAINVNRTVEFLHTLNIDSTMQVKNLSFGQLRRIYLAKCLARDVDILLLDEPTNHLDIQTIQWPEQQILKFRGAAIVMSHDRRFLENTTTGILWLINKTIHHIPRPFRNFEAWQDAFYTGQNKLDKNVLRPV